LVKNSIIEIDVKPFSKWYLQHYGVVLGKKSKGVEEDTAPVVLETTGRSKRVVYKLKKRNLDRFIDPNVSG